MKKMGFEIREDGRTEWQNNGGIIERRALYAANPEWETVADTTETPRNAAELEAFCAAGGFGYEAPNER